MSIFVEKGAIADAVSLLEKRYKRTYNRRMGELNSDIEFLLESCAEFTDEEIYAGVKYHVIDDELDPSGVPYGKWMPDPPRLRGVIKKLREEQRQEEKKKINDYQEAVNSKHVKLDGDVTLIKIDDPFLKKILKKDYIECIPVTAYECQVCCDTGRVRFYYDKDNRRNVYTANEFLNLYEKNKPMAMTLRISECVCDNCRLGTIFGMKSPMSPLRSTIKNLAIERRKREEAMRAKVIQTRQLVLDEEEDDIPF